MNTYADWKPVFDKIPEGLMASAAQREFFFNLGRITTCGIEVGTFKGFSLALFAAGMTCAGSLRHRQLYSIDTFRCSAMDLDRSVPDSMEDTLPIAKAAIQSVGGSHLVTWIVADNRVGFESLPAGLQADWVYLDADHAYETTLQNARDYAPFVKPGGLVMFHDYDSVHFRTVVEAVRQAVAEHIIQPLAQWDDFFVGTRV